MVNGNENQQVKKRTSKGKQKIEIKKIEKKSARQVTFNKRRNGLFNKCSQMSAEFGSQFAIITFSEAGNPFVSGYPSADDVIKRFLDDSRNNVVVGSEPSTSCSSSNGKWWENPIDGMSLDELERFKFALENLRKDVASRTERTIRVNDTQIISFGCNNSNLGVQEPVEIIDFRCTDARNNGVYLSEFCAENINVGNTNTNLGIPEAFTGAQFKASEVNEVVVQKVEPSNGAKILDAIDGINLSDFLNKSTRSTNFVNWDNFGCTDATNGIYLSDLCNETKIINVGSNNSNLGVQASNEKLDLGVMKGSVGGQVSDYYEWMDKTMTEIYPGLLPLDGCSFLDMLTCS